MRMFEHILPNTEATVKAGAAMAALVKAGDCLLLEGDLGMGKTTFARGLVGAYAGVDEVPSPTFTLMQTYDGAQGELIHCDLYRVEDESELEELGFDELIETVIALIEWPDRLGSYRPQDYLVVTLKAKGEGRVLSLLAHGAWEGRLDDIANAITDANR